MRFNTVKIAVWASTIIVLGSGCATPKVGVLVMAHGGDDAWNQDVEATVAPLKGKYPIEIAFGMARTSTMRKAVRRLEDQRVSRIAVVRMFVSGDSFLQPTEYILGLSDEVQHPHHKMQPAHVGFDGASGSGHHMETPERISTTASFILSRAGVADSELVEQILVDRIEELSTNPEEESVLILAHGPADEAENERWLANMRLRAQRIHDLGPFRHVQCETLREDWPKRRAEAARPRRV